MAVGNELIINKAKQAEIVSASTTIKKSIVVIGSFFLATTLFTQNSLAQNKHAKSKTESKTEKKVEENLDKKDSEQKPDFVKQFKTSFAEERFEALNQLFEANHPETVDFIGVALKDEDWLLRSRALQLIAQLPTNKRSSLLLEIHTAIKDPYWFVRGNAALALSEIAAQAQPSEKSFVERSFELLSEMRLDENSFVRSQTIKAIAASKNSSAVDYIAPLLLDENSNVRSVAAMSLVDLNERKAVNHLLTARQLKGETDKIFSVALYHFGELDSLPYLLSSLEQANIELKRQIIKILYQANDIKAVDALVKQLQNTLTEEPRDEKTLFPLITSLSQLPTKSAIEALKTLLNDQNRPVQLAAIEALSNTKNPEIVPTLINRLLAARDREMGDALIKAISSFQQVETIDELFRVRKDSKGEVRPVIDITLGKMGINIDNLSQAVKTGKSPKWQPTKAATRWLAALNVPSSLEPLAAALSNPDPEVRTEAAQALGKFGDRAAVEPLISLLEDPVPTVKLTAIEALKNLGINANSLSKRLQSSDWRTRADAANLVGRLGIIEVVPLLINNVNDKELAPRLESINALAKLKDKRATSTLLIALDDENASVRATVAVALGNLGDEKAAEPLVKMLTSYDVALGALAADSLIKLSSNNATPALIKTLSSRNWRARAQAARVLGYLKPESAIAALIPLLNDPAAPARYYAGQTLSKMGQVAINPLIDALRKDSHALNRYGVARALATIGTPSVEPLCKLLTDSDESLRVLATIVLGDIRDTQAIDPLVMALDDIRFSVRSSAASALAQMGEAALNPVLESLKNKNSSRCRAAAALTLRNLALHEAMPALILALSDKEDAVRANAAEALSAIGDKTAISYLEQLTKTDKADTVRAAAQAAINKIQKIQ
jgi:HEAT repeat protein